MNMTYLYPRLIEPHIAEALLDTPVVLLAGPRQVGKTTLVRQIAQAAGATLPDHGRWHYCRQGKTLSA
jgi:hypothetical protein